MNLQDIPIEILFLILRFLNSERDIISLSGTCKRFRSSIPLKLKTISCTSDFFHEIPNVSFPIRKLSIINITEPEKLIKVLESHRETLKEIVLDFFENKKESLSIEFLGKTRRFEKTVFFFSKTVNDVRININTKILHIISSITKNDILRTTVFSELSFEKVICDPYVNLIIEKPIKKLIISIYDVKKTFFDLSHYQVENLKIDINSNILLRTALFVFKIPNCLRVLNITNSKIEECFVDITKSPCQFEKVSFKNIRVIFNKDNIQSDTMKINTMLLIRAQIFNNIRLIVKNLLIRFSDFYFRNMEIQDLYTFCNDLKTIGHLISRTVHVKVHFFQDLERIKHLKDTSLLKDISQITLHIQEMSFNRNLLISVIDFLKEQGFLYIAFKRCLSNILNSSFPQSPFSEFSLKSFYILTANRNQIEIK
jgi:hypothetical protein